MILLKYLYRILRPFSTTVIGVGSDSGLTGGGFRVKVGEYPHVGFFRR